MKAVDENEIESFLKARRIAKASRSLSYGNGFVNAINISLPKEALKIFALTHVLLGHLQNDQYQGSMFWLVENDIWAEDTEAMGANILQGMGIPDGALGRDRCYIFGSEDQVRQKALLALTMLFQWDAYVVPNHGRHYLYVSHDGFLQVSSESEQQLSDVTQLMSYWNPKKL